MITGCGPSGFGRSDGRRPRLSARLRARWHRQACIIGTLLLLAHWRGTAAAQDPAYSNFLVGERALGMAGAFVALADDPSAIFHNPSGMATLGTGSVSGSLWALSVRQRRVDSAVVTPFGAGAFDQGDVTSLPLFVGAVARVGHRTPTGQRRHAIGLSLFAPGARDYRYTVTLNSGDGSGLRQLDLDQNDSSLWLGLGYAVELSPHWKLGASLFLARRSIDHAEFELTSRGTGDPPLGRSAIAEITSHALALRLGALYTPAPKWQLGLMLQVPPLAFGSDAQTTVLSPTFASDNVTPNGFDLRQRQGRARLPIPWEARLGATYRWTDSGLVTAEASVVGAAGEAGAGVIDPIDGFALLPTASDQPLSLRAAAGFEWVVGGAVPLRGGVLWEMPRRPRLPVRSEGYLARRLSHLGVALSVGIRTSDFDFSLGATALLARGEAMSLVRRGTPFEMAYERTQTSEHLIVFYLAGGRSAVHMVAEQVKPLLAPD